ncbi:hypothetical protein [Streptomyces sp. NPDC020607]|uniref:glycine-rich domain-containing protein n=1 Tax=Streptomyces sp. NPDC020607 TaxID=3365082 RepID=UPI0037AD4C4F
MRFSFSGGPQSAALVSLLAATSLLASPAVAAAPTPEAPPAVAAATVKTFREPGTYTFVLPKGTKQARVQVMSGGGGGGGGGGYNNGQFTGGGGGAGGGAAAITCGLNVGNKGTPIPLPTTITVGAGGAGGKAGEGKDGRGSAGTAGGPTIIKFRSQVVMQAESGEPGKGGEGSQTFRSGNGNYGGEGGNAMGRTHCFPHAENVIRKSGGKGDSGQDGKRNDSGAGGMLGAPGMIVDSCRKRPDDYPGAGGDGGSGAGVTNKEGHKPKHMPADPGKQGGHGCVVVTYS